MENFQRSSPPTKKHKFSAIKVVPILDDAISSTDIVLRSVFTAQLKCKKDASNLLKQLPLLPSELDHLKRIRNNNGELEIVIGIDCLSHDHPSNAFLIPSSIVQKDLPANRPVSTLQFKKSNSIWPCNFHPEKEIEKLLAENAGFTNEELAIISNNVTTVIDKSTTLNKAVCAIYDPCDEEFVCFASSCEGLLNHSVMNCLKLLAVTQNKSEKEEILKTNWEIGEIVCEKRIVRNAHTDYLCTGLEVYLSHEPCVMCAMALLHSRAKKIFFINESVSNGSLKSTIKLHCLEGINHRFQVFQVEVI